MTRENNNQLAAVFFDLDGTLLDTAPDMANALVHLLNELEHPLPEFEKIRDYVSYGALGLIRMATGIDRGDARFEDLKSRFLSIYEKNLCRDTRLFPGFDILLKQLENNNIPWGVVTNKPAYLTDPIMKALSLSARSCAVISGDTVEHAKPHPAPLLEACRRAEVKPEHCLYVGDAERDIIAGNAAGMLTLSARYGYIPQDEDPNQWPANGQVDSAADIWEYLQERFAL